MVFSSGVFLIYFLPLVLLGYYLLPFFLKNYFLLLASILFYAWGAPLFVFAVILSSAVNFWIAGRINAHDQRSKRWLILYCVSNLLLLAYFKYSGFFIENFNLALKSAGFGVVEWTHVALPIGISFYTFQSITYGVDIYRKDAAPLKKYSDYLFYILFFPQLIAGPIVRFKEIAHEIRVRHFDSALVLSGFFRFSIGLAKKGIIANTLAEFYSVLSDSQLAATVPSSSIEWLMALVYTLQLFFDFSGYSDMAIGIGRVFGFHFPENFDRPYLAKNITEFWRRWHITLGTFMMNYLYIPLGGNRKGHARLYVNLMIVFFLSGLWHGASWNFVIWGLFHGFWMIMDRLFLAKISERMRFFFVPFTFFLVLNGWVLFNADSMGMAWEKLKIMYSFNDVNIVLPYHLEYYLTFLMAAIFLVLFTFSKSYNRLKFAFYDFHPEKRGTIFLYCMSGILYFIAFAYILSSDFNPFIYFKF